MLLMTDFMVEKHKGPNWPRVTNKREDEKLRVFNK